MYIIVSIFLAWMIMNLKYYIGYIVIEKFKEIWRQNGLVRRAVSMRRWKNQNQAYSDRELLN